uniref:hypothetical protein n=1 Tax=Corynebacterium parakroppenstedtii TaxID=2828363 RepID=UPI0030EB1DE3
ILGPAPAASNNRNQGKRLGTKPGALQWCHIQLFISLSSRQFNVGDITHVGALFHPLCREDLSRTPLSVETAPAQRFLSAIQEPTVGSD